MRRGLKVTAEMQRLIDRPGFLASDDGGQRLRDLYVEGSIEFTSEELSPFGLDCYLGLVEEVKKAVEKGTGPDLLGTETAYKFGYLTLVVSGKHRVQYGPPGMDHVATIRYLIKQGCPIESEDIVGYTAVMHACINRGEPDVARALAAGGADTNHQNKYGVVALTEACMQNQVKCISILMEYGASLDIPDADGYVWRDMYLKCGPFVVAEIQKWLRKRSGEDSLLQTKSCDICGKSNKDPRVKLSFCGRCRLRRYCSPECQRIDWKTHKKSCRGFDATETTVTVKPVYFSPNDTTINPAEALRSMMDSVQLPSVYNMGPQTPDMSGVRMDLTPGRQFILKVQVPLSGVVEMMVYNKKRDFRCLIRREGNGRAYDRIKQVIQEKGIMAAKAYFQAELKGRDQLLIQTGEVLAEQPF